MLSKMRFIAFAAVLARLTSAQGSLPPCATDCVTQFTSGSAIGGCNNIDIKCICSNQDFLSGIACCLEGKCSVADQQAATDYAIGFCKISGVTGLPTAVSQLCTSTVSSSTPPSTASSAGAAATSITSSASSAESSASSAASNASGSVSSAVSSASSVASSVASQASTSSSAAASATKNASPQNVAGLGAGVLGGLAAAVVLL